MPKFIVETIAVFKHTYEIEADAAEHALDIAVCNEVEEIDQHFVDEMITGIRLASDNELPLDPIEAAKKLDKPQS